LDERFPKYLRFIIRKLDFLALPNLSLLVCGLSVLAFFAENFMGAPLDRFLFDPNLVLQGQWWRLFPFPGLEVMGSPIWMFFYVLYVYFIMGGMEAEWGAPPLTIFVLFSYLMTIAGSFVAMEPVSIWFYILENIGLAFGTLFPDVEFYLFFILPVKAKWFSLFLGGVYLFQFIVGDIHKKLFLLLGFSPYLIFFGPLLYARIRTWYRVRKNRQRFGDDR
jgi:hypothetical protein